MPLPTTPAAIDPLFRELPGEGPVLVVPVAGPGVAHQRPLYEQRAHGRPLVLAPNRPGLTPGVASSALGLWLGGLSFSKDPAPKEAALEQLSGHAGTLVVREPYVSRVTDALGPPSVEQEGHAAWVVP